MDGRSEADNGLAGPSATPDSRGMSQLLVDGYVVLPGPVDAADLALLSRAYDEAVAAGDTGGVRHGSTSVRANGLANREACFDPIYVHPPLLAAAREVISGDFKLSGLLARSVRPYVGAQMLHQDFPPLDDGWPMLGFILMVDPFTRDNGATRFLRGSQWLAALPDEPEGADERTETVCGPAGSMIVFNGSVWHGHGPNRTSAARRSIQGALIRRDQLSAVDYAREIRPEVAKRWSPTARALLCLPEA
jgi:ectoine hydroxylase-related dioxygenase (phytanoyl-CoA dioxygenase family)